MTGRASYDLVVPTLARPSLRHLVLALARGSGPLPNRLIIVDDRPGAPCPLPLPALGRLRGRVEIVSTRRRGPAAARNAGWRKATSEWVVFVDDDVVPERAWLSKLDRDLAALPERVGGSQGRVWVPVEDGRVPTDWERNVRRLEGTPWITADMAYRRSMLERVGGFDERFRRAYREDTELAVRIVSSGTSIVWGTRTVVHPVQPARRWASVRSQAGNHDDVVMTALHGRGWRADGEPRGRRDRHLAITAAAATAGVGAVFGEPLVAALAVAGWVVGTAELAWARIAPGPRTRDEVAEMVLTSVVLPAAATAYWLRGVARSVPIAWCRYRSTPAAVRARRPPTPSLESPSPSTSADLDGWVAHITSSVSALHSDQQMVIASSAASTAS